MDPYKYINSLSRFGTDAGFKPGLDRINALLGSFNHPEDRLKVIHVAGTNGKGSTIAFLKSIYTEAGYRVGVYTSPHLIHFNERIEVGNRAISTAELTDLVSELVPRVEDLKKDPEVGGPTYFEFVTALALLYFARKDVDLVLLEVGLGGRLDATNVIKEPLVSVITSISLDHTSILGNDVKSIAREKSGIIKRDCPVVTGVRNKEALRVIEETAKLKNSPLKIIDKEYSYNIIESSLEGQSFTVFRLNNGDYSLEKEAESINGTEKIEYFIKLPGVYQVRNALLAMAVVDYLQEQYPVNLVQIKKGLASAFIPGRMEVLARSPLIIADGAHNVEGVKKLVNSLGPLINEDRQFYIIVGILGDKDVEGMIEMLDFGKAKKELIITRNTNSRSCSPEVIGQYAQRRGIKYRVYPDLKTSLTGVLNDARPEDVICVTGSLYTVSEAKILVQSGIKHNSQS
ncbi:bifunctional folylpolyglutamate synthase/dihydrofolate synthase [Halothermothrix orenii]|uniref:tetrahydrofolate synthase n=1 Tax=Halothermothrix orenii (strain H 168 / OCM 544 / DSM 9562) TaxID=373903 RepID=B8CY17_HALOH|nr:folylpolyglutamate synthase/dihydrofolate synthase family protein [Halothermothrix orenii]ACL70186.1 Folylpolyglutamate synthase [Halothermothrix orenii H 168]